MVAQIQKTEITATEFKQAAGAYIEKSAKEPVIITKHGRPARVLIDIEEYERLKAKDTARTFHVSELDDEVLAEILDTENVSEGSRQAQLQLDKMTP